MSVVVTGAAGFIGRHVVQALRAAGHDVVGIDRRPLPGTVDLHRDLVDGHPDVGDALAGATAVIHLAGRPGVRDRSPGVAAGRWHDNVEAGLAVLRATPASTPLVVASSSSVYGGAVRGRRGWDPCHEDQPLAPRGGYARSKAVLEAHCAARRAAGGHVVVVRPFTVAGEGQRADMALATWLAEGRAGRPFTILGDPRRRRDVTDVRDVVTGLLAATRVPHATTVNLGTGTTHTLHDLSAAVADHLGVPHRLRVLEAGREEVAVTRADTRRCRALLGLAPATDLDDLVRRQAAAAATATAPPHDRRLEPA